MLTMHSLIRKFFDSAKDLALAVVERIDGFEMPDDVELIPVNKLLADVEGSEFTIDVAPKRHGYVFGVRMFCEPSDFEILEMRNTKDGIDRICPGADIDASYFNDDRMCCPFDLGEVDPAHPIRLKVRLLERADRRGVFNAVLFASEKPHPMMSPQAHGDAAQAH